MLTKGQKNLWLLTADNSNGNFDPPLQKEDSGTWREAMFHLPQVIK